MIKARHVGPDLGLATMGDAVRYPDALVTCAQLDGRAPTVSGLVAVFEIVSPGSGGVDRMVKVREYAAVASIRCYVIIESTSVGMLVLHRDEGADAWTAESLAGTDDLKIAALGIDSPVAEIYETVELPAGAMG